MLMVNGILSKLKAPILALLQSACTNVDNNDNLFACGSITRTTLLTRNRNCML